MPGILGVHGTVKARIALVKTGFNHLENVFVPLANLVPVAILERSALYLCDLTYLFSTEAIDLLTKQNGYVLVVY